MFFLSTCPPHQISEKRTSYLQRWEFTAEGFARTCARIAHICLKVFIPSIFALRCRSALFNNCLHALRQNLKACNAEDSVTLKHAIDSVGLAHTQRFFNRSHRLFAKRRNIFGNPDDLVHDHTNLGCFGGSERNRSRREHIAISGESFGPPLRD